MESAVYWDARYRAGKGSGRGSRGEAADAKAAHINAVVRRHRIGSMIDLGVGDGQVASRLDVRCYLGVDVSSEALDIAKKVVGDRAGWSWLLCDPRVLPPIVPSADLTVSSDVIFHLVDDVEYRRHLDWLFLSPRVLVHSTNFGSEPQGHIRHHGFTQDVPETHRLVDAPYDPTRIGFYEFERLR